MTAARVVTYTHALTNAQVLTFTVHPSPPAYFSNKSGRPISPFMVLRSGGPMLVSQRAFQCPLVVRRPGSHIPHSLISINSMQCFRRRLALLLVMALSPTESCAAEPPSRMHAVAADREPGRCRACALIAIRGPAIPAPAEPPSALHSAGPACNTATLCAGDTSPTHTLDNVIGAAIMPRVPWTTSTFLTAALRDSFERPQSMHARQDHKTPATQRIGGEEKMKTWRKIMTSRETVPRLPRIQGALASRAGRL